MSTASAPGKIILFGEHAVVYGRPALAVPVTQVQAHVEITGTSRRGIWIEAPEVNLHSEVNTLPSDHPIAAVIHNLLFGFGISPFPSLDIKITSTIPVAAGLGSGAAVSVALIRALAVYLGQTLSDEQVNAFAYEIEKLHHGTPSGIDNTVITYACPVYFIRGQRLETLHVAQPFTLVIGDTGTVALTKESVGDVRKLWEAEPGRLETIFDQVGEIVERARDCIQAGKVEPLGALMDANHTLLQEMTVSSPELDALVRAARHAGALGAKLSGGGRGGNMIALVRHDMAEDVAAALREVRCGPYHHHHSGFMNILILKLILAPLILGSASLAGRRWGSAVSGWLVGMPLTTGPVVFFVALSHNAEFAARSGLGVLSGGFSLVLYAVSYAWLARRLHWLAALSGSLLLFAISTILLEKASFPLVPLFFAVLASHLPGAAADAGGNLCRAEFRETGTLGPTGAHPAGHQRHPAADRHSPLHRPAPHRTAGDLPPVYFHPYRVRPAPARAGCRRPPAARAAIWHVRLRRIFPYAGVIDRADRDRMVIQRGRSDGAPRAGKLPAGPEEIHLAIGVTLSSFEGIQEWPRPAPHGWGTAPARPGCARRP